MGRKIHKNVLTKLASFVIIYFGNYISLWYMEINRNTFYTKPSGGQIGEENSHAQRTDKAGYQEDGGGNRIS